MSLLAGLTSPTCFANDTAKRLFDESAPMVFQVKVIDKGSGNKSTIGSGFQIAPSGVIATNYHVVSKYVLDKEQHSIEVLDHNDMPVAASLINFDVVHDLALLQLKQAQEPSFTLSLEPLLQGTRIYSMGNPHDLGMTIIEGNYNGLVEGSRYQKYLFSGSLNGGMSGGPVLDSDGEIIGVNVSKGGEQLSFLVPVTHLNNLMAQGYTPLDSEQYKTHTLNSLIEDQDEYYKALFELDWQTKAFQQFELPDKIHESLKC
ncbi:MAG: serine protease, partial [Porticoccaceae bacterium]|nr:serine protease [Porticoccaceae bacterium]